MEQHTLVAFYGKKTEAFSFMIQSVWREIQQSSLKEYFTPYGIDQVHATICGLESIPVFPHPFNLNVWEKTGEKKQMKVAGLPSTLEDFLPLTIQFGGFPEAFSAVKSFGQSLYQRTFKIDWVSGRVILIGWPVDPRHHPTDALLQLRQALYQKHQILHKYEGDKDCYLVLGKMHGHDSLSPKAKGALKSEQERLEKKIRMHFAAYPQQIQLKLNHLSVIEYTDSTLPLSSSQSWPLDKIDELFK